MSLSKNVRPVLVGDTIHKYIWEEFGTSTSFFALGHGRAVDEYIEKYRTANGIRPGGPLNSDRYHKIHGKTERTTKACHVTGLGISGKSKVFNCFGLDWRIESHEHPDIGKCIKVTIDTKKGYHVFIRKPLKACTFNKCNGNPKCNFDHPRGYFAPVEKEVKVPREESPQVEEEVEEEVEDAAPGPILPESEQ